MASGEDKPRARKVARARAYDADLSRPMGRSTLIEGNFNNGDIVREQVRRVYYVCGIEFFNRKNRLDLIISVLLM